MLDKKRVFTKIFIMLLVIEEALRLGAADLSGIDKKLDHVDD